MDKPNSRFVQLKRYWRWCITTLVAWLFIYFRLPGQYPLVAAAVNTLMLILVLPAFLDLLARESLVTRNYKLTNLLITPAVVIGEILDLIPGNPYALGLPYFLSIKALALIKLEQGKSAEKVLRQLSVLYQQMPDVHPMRIAETSMLMGNALSQQGKFAESEAITKQAIDMLETQSDKRPTITAATLGDLCIALTKEGKAKQALEAGKRALSIMENINNPNEHEQIILGMTWNNLAVAYDYVGDAAKAQDLYQKSLELKLKIFGNNSKEAVIGYNNLGYSLLLQSKYDEADTPLEKAKNLAIALGLQNSRIWMNILGNCGDAHRGQGRFAEAEIELLEALKLREQGKNEQLHESYYFLGKLYRDKQDFFKAKSYFDKALQIREKRFGKEHPKVAETLEDYGKLLAASGRENEAQQMHERAQLIREQIGKY